MLETSRARGGWWPLLAASALGVILVTVHRLAAEIPGLFATEIVPMGALIAPAAGVLTVWCATSHHPVEQDSVRWLPPRLLGLVILSAGLTLLPLWLGALLRPGFDASITLSALTAVGMGLWGVALVPASAAGLLPLLLVLLVGDGTNPWLLLVLEPSRQQWTICAATIITGVIAWSASWARGPMLAALVPVVRGVLQR